MNSTLNSLNRRSAVALTISLITLAAGFRLLRATLLPELPNFSPVLALAVCGALVLPGALALLVPLVALAITDLLLNLHYGVALFSPVELVSYACYGLGVATGISLRRLGAGAPLTFGAVIANSTLFYVVTNSLAWFGNPAYAQSPAGWIQALTVGVPGFPPTWIFFTYSLASDLLFTGIFLGIMHFTVRPRGTELAAARA